MKDKKKQSPLMVRQVEKMSLTDIVKLIDIKSTLRGLLSKDQEKVKAALNTLCAMNKYGGRKEALYVLVGYYRIEIKTMDEIIRFFDWLQLILPEELSLMILNDVARFKEVARQALFIHYFIRHLKSILRDSDETQKKEIRALIEGSVWGYKLKRKFLEELFEDYNDDDLF
jgi:hypothetical protein